MISTQLEDWFMDTPWKREGDEEPEESMSGERGAASVRDRLARTGAVVRRAALAADAAPLDLFLVEREMADAAALLDEVREVLESVEWVQHTEDCESWSECPECRNMHNYGHTDDCRLSALLSRLKREEASR